MSEFKPGDRVVTWMEDVGTVVGPASLKDKPWETMVLVDGDKNPTPWLDCEIMLEED